MNMFFPILYACVSSTLSIANKWAMLGFPFAGLLTAAQFLFTFLFVSALSETCKLEPFSMVTAKKLAPINCVFYAAIFTNTKLLQNANVETFIAFRSATPLLVCMIDTLFRKQPMPSMRTIACLVGILVGAFAYAQADDNFSVTAYGWAFTYLAIITFEMVYAKHVVSSMGINTWDLVRYQNLIAFCLWPCAALLTGEFSQLAELDVASLDMATLFPVFVTCILGTAISFAGWGTRSQLSATSFTVLGVACKLATVLINLTVWEHHASYTAQLPILLCMFSSVAYQQSSKRDQLAREASSKDEALEGAENELSEKEGDLPQLGSIKV